MLNVSSRVKRSFTSNIFSIVHYFNAFVRIGPFLYPLEQRVSDGFLLSSGVHSGQIDYSNKKNLKNIIYADFCTK